LIEIGSKTAEKNSAQTNKQTERQTDRQTNRHYENNGHLAMNQKTDESVLSSHLYLPIHSFIQLSYDVCLQCFDTVG